MSLEKAKGILAVFKDPLTKEERDHVAWQFCLEYGEQLLKVAEIAKRFVPEPKVIQWDRREIALRDAIEDLETLYGFRQDRKFDELVDQLNNPDWSSSIDKINEEMSNEYKDKK